MNLVKWIRKNNRKIMVFVVIFCMVSFVIGYTGLQIIASIFNPNKQVIAHYGDGQKIKNIDLASARNDLDVLRMLMSEQLLASQGLPGALLTHLIFPDSKIAGDIAAQLKQAVQQGQLEISLEELEAYFNQQPQRPEDLWILLKAEAYQAGFVISDENAKQILRVVIPQILKVDTTLVVEQIMNKTNLTETQIVRIYADLLTVVNYANTVMDNESITLNQIKAFLGRTEERLDAEFVKIDAASLVDNETAVSDEDLMKQFEAYKQIAPNDPTPDNPFGFGYKLPKRVQIEYMVLLMDDVKSQIEKLTPEALEEYYSSNIERFQTQVPSDPNDPESEKITQTRSFAEVEPQIRTLLESDKSSKLASVIFNELKEITETGFEEITFEEATPAQLQMAAGDYMAAAQTVSAGYNVPIVAGKTGWLSAADMSRDKILSGLRLQQQTRIPLAELLLAVSENTKQAPRKIGMPTIRVWQNIGPVKGGYYSMEEEKYIPLMAMVRVVGTEEAKTPETADVEYSTRGIVLAEAPDSEESKVVLKDNVKDNLLLQQAMGTARARAEEFATLAEEKGWDQAIAAYNEKYPVTDPDPDSTEQTQAIKLENIKQQTRASQADIMRIKMYIQEHPTAAGYVQQNLIKDMLNNRLYDMLPQDGQSTGTIHQVLDFEPQAACYVVKDVTRQPATLEDYLDNKASTAMQLNGQGTASLALVHLSPENILKRMNYQPELREQATQEIPVETTDEDNVEE